MSAWLDHLAKQLELGETVILITTVKVEGSAPREVGATMVVGKSAIFGTIGGGELEWRAMELARVLLDRKAVGGRAVTNVLGPDLGQCCGGRVTLTYEPFAPGDLDWVRQLQRAGSEPQGAGRALLIILKSNEIKRSVVPAPQLGFTAEVSDGIVSLVQRIAPDRQPLWLFGAGHVGRALARALAPLPFAVTWVDARQNGFAGCDDHGAKMLTMPIPDLGVSEAPAGTFFLVMTHGHDVDEEICAAILARDDFAYLGLIGSATKKAQFNSRLAGRGLGAEALARLHCPIGIAGLKGKDPNTIASSVVADLLLRLGGKPKQTNEF
ncbi:Xanthine and CO dehydrogenases maturation factor, XdhC/CoxF family [hydrothermal vent metagenome]|uniref:Xanthine and CO dehydrogenases maturation factor, XdhC/CoxF family n=1 Tax=hydrothermal vent metagenome TaxID=652676 RepID=A0A3B0SZ59_9ZZZZ